MTWKECNFCLRIICYSIQLNLAYLLYIAAIHNTSTQGTLKKEKSIQSCHTDRFIDYVLICIHPPPPESIHSLLTPLLQLKSLSYVSNTFAHLETEHFAPELWKTGHLGWMERVHFKPCHKFLTGLRTELLTVLWSEPSYSTIVLLELVSSQW